DQAVREVLCIKTDRQYAALVDGGQEYEVVFDYDPQTHCWSVECTCPVTFECKHAFAAMLALQANAAKLSVAEPVPGAKPNRKGKEKHIALTLREEPQPPSSALVSALTQALGRKLARIEIDYIQQIQRLYQQAKSGLTMTAEALRQLAPALKDYSWHELELWPEFPRDDLWFWLYCAWELRRRGFSGPRFMQGISDFTQVEPAMKSWERRRLIESWRAQLAHC